MEKEIYRIGLAIELYACGTIYRKSKKDGVVYLTGKD